MKKKLSACLAALLLTVLLLPCLADTAWAGDLDYINRYDITVAPNPEDGSLRIRAELQWTVLEEGPVDHLQVGVPNGSIREVEPLSGNIDFLDFDNSFMYIYFTQGYDTGETFSFAYEWTQEYMYTLDESGGVQYDYTPGWFDEAEIGEMTLTWLTPEALQPIALNGSGSGVDVESDYADDGAVFTARNLPHGARMNLWVGYDSWPVELYWEESQENLPQDDYYEDSDQDYEREQIIRTTVKLIVLAVILVLIFSRDGYAGGFGTRYILYHGLWYPQGPDGRPRPGSTGTKHKPKPPRGGFGGGDRGGGFGGGGFGGGGGHCACASSCACACACACAGGGRAGCSAKNLYGAVKLSRELTEELQK